MKNLIKSMFESGVLHVLVLGLALAAIFLLGGCALERADPAARSNRAVYTITVTAHGDSSTASAYISDGLMATADGEGAITQPSTLTTEQSPDITVPGDAVSAGIQAVGHVAGKIIDAKAGTASQTSQASQASQVCPGGNCAPGVCADGSCGE